MTIVDAIRSASTPHAVFFLVTAYIESLGHFERSSGVPRLALALPIGGVHDLARRARLLETMPLPLESVVAASELGAVLDCAVARLSALHEPLPRDGVMPSARSDSRRSALSV